MSEFVPGHRGGGRAGFKSASLRPSTWWLRSAATRCRPATRTSL